MPTASDPCVYVQDEAGELFFVTIYVDDIILGGSSEDRMKEVKQELSKQFEMTDLGTLHYFLGVKVVQDLTAGHSGLANLPTRRRSSSDTEWMNANRSAHQPILK